MKNSVPFLQYFPKRSEEMNNISFPKLGISFDINPVAIDLPFLGGVHWYGVIIAAGIILAVIYCSIVAKREGESVDTITDILLYSLPVAIICARLYYVVFSWENYRDNPMDIFKIWEGGLAIYGGIIGAVIAAGTYLKIKKMNVLKLFDICCLGVIIGQSVGRWGNFVNAEAFGGECSYIWGMSINGADCVHPTFLYESLWNISGFLILSHLHKKRPYYGFTFFSYVAWYGIGRFFIEGLRSDSLYIGSIRVSQLLALICIILGTVVNFFLFKKNKQQNKTENL